MTGKVPLEALLPRVEKPSRYLGLELNSVHKPEGKVRLRAALAFPDLYEVGMSHLGTHLLYALGNRLPGVSVERAFLPAPDMRKALAEADLPLFTLEGRAPLASCDLLGITLQSELTYTNVLAVLSDGGIPLRAAERGEEHPLVVGGGPCACNPEPLADFFDLFFLGEAEAGWPLLLAKLLAAKDAGGGRGDRLAALKGVPGLYHPQDWEVAYRSDGVVERIVSRTGARAAERSLCRDLPRRLPPSAFLVPFLQAVHDRVSLEAVRGCTRGCRFCQAGMIYRPVREKDPDALLSDAEMALAATGYEEVSLLSLSIGDYHPLDRVLSSFMDRHEGDRVAVSLPSLRVGTLTPDMAVQIGRVRRTSFTLAPEAGTERLRRAINKPFTDGEILEAASHAFRQGWEAVKLYFMIGLPGESEEDLAGIVRLAKAVAAASPARGHVTVSISPFVPKPHTPFQWAVQEEEAALRAKLELLKEGLRGKKLQVRWGRTDQAVVEGFLARGDRRLGRVVEAAFRAGACMDGWQEHFRFELWKEALAGCGLDAGFYTTRPRGKDEVFPWEHISYGVEKGYLRKEYENSLAELATGDCREAGCAGCGACDEGMKKNLPPLRVTISSPAEPGVPDAGGKEGTGATAKPEAAEPSARRIRLLFEKKGDLRFLGHLETAHAFERAARRSRLPLAFSRGFSPKPRITFALSLPLGVEGEAEWLDLELTESLPPAEAAERLNRSLPAGLRVTSAWKAPPGAASLNGRVRGTVWRAEFPAPVAGLAGKAESLRARKTIPMVRVKENRSRTLDLAPFLRAVEAEGDQAVSFTLSFSEEGSIRPQELLEALLAGSVPEGTLLARIGLLMAPEEGKGYRPGMMRVWD